ncbi:MAG TPA: zinc ribbon domain-containing protein [Tessaracoccus flavescens]|uniref:Zinc ribbon domain-containing protein n=1 Tax=Tessaracoccus flavescens TaxID=399497 RepID=A0A921JQE2_9ACTN|nr:zinc ribbon domain-containing protein [Tessaracoccus flavescens]
MSNPGLSNQSTVRTGLRAAAVVLLVLGVVLLFVGIPKFMASWDNPMAGGPGDIMLIAAGGFCLVGGLAAAQVGWLREASRYTAGETAPVIKDTIDYVRGEPTAPETAADGPFCSQCGTRAAASAKFCGSCGTALS